MKWFCAVEKNVVIFTVKSNDVVNLMELSVQIDLFLHGKLLLELKYKSIGPRNKEPEKDCKK